MHISPGEPRRDRHLKLALTGYSTLILGPKSPTHNNPEKNSLISPLPSPSSRGEHALVEARRILDATAGPTYRI